MRDNKLIRQTCYPLVVNDDGAGQTLPVQVVSWCRAFPFRSDIFWNHFFLTYNLFSRYNYFYVRFAFNSIRSPTSSHQDRVILICLTHSWLCSPKRAVLLLLLLSVLSGWFCSNFFRASSKLGSSMLSIENYELVVFNTEFTHALAF